MILESDKIRIEFTKPEYLQKIIKSEQDNSDFIGQYNFEEHQLFKPRFKKELFSCRRPSTDD